MNDFLYDLVTWCFNKIDKLTEWLYNNADDVFDEIDEFLKMFD